MHASPLSLLSAASASAGEQHFLRDMALVLCVAAVTTILFQRLRQPVVLGYLLAGLILGPHIPIPLAADPGTLETLSELGVVLLMFAVGLDLDLRRLRELGPTAAVVALLELGLMMGLGFNAARLLGWTPLECLYASVIVAISSTVLIRKVFLEFNVDQELRQVVTSVTVFEDLFAILLLAALTAFAQDAEVDGQVLLHAAGRLGVFLALVIVGGLLVVPRLMRYVIHLRRRETILVASVGTCFAFALIAERAGYSVALGAFLAGMLVAESGAGARVAALVEPVQDLFAAVFFVSVGMLMNPGLVVAHWPAVLLLFAVVLVGKVGGVSLGLFLSGKDKSVALQAGFGMAQVGELSLVIAALGVASKATGEFMYPVTVGVASLTAFASPLLMRNATPLSQWIDRKLPHPLQNFATLYSGWLETAREQTVRDQRWKRVRRSVQVIALDTLVLAAVIIAGAVTSRRVAEWLAEQTGIESGWAPWLVVGASAIAAALPVWGIVRATGSLGTLVSEMAVTAKAGANPQVVKAPRRALVVALQAAAILTVGVVLIVVTQPFVPGNPVAVALLFLLVPLVIAFWRSAANLQGHLRAGAEVFAEALMRESRDAGRGAMDAAVEMLPGLGDIEVVRLAAGAPGVDQTLSELNLRGRSDATVVAIVRGDRRIVMPDAQEELHAGDVLALTGTQASIEHAREILCGAQSAAPPLARPRAST